MQYLYKIMCCYNKDPKYSDRQGCASSIDHTAAEQSDQSLHCLPFCLHLLNATVYGNATLLKF